MKESWAFPPHQWDFGSQDMLNTLTQDEYEFLIGRQSVQRYRRGEIIFKEGHIPSGIFYIRSGKVKKYKVSRDERETIIYIAREKEFIGYHALLAEERYPDSAAALESCKICFIPRDDFIKILKQSTRLNDS